MKSVAVVAPTLSPTLTRLTLVCLWFFTGAAYGCVWPFIALYAQHQGLSLSMIGVLGACSSAAAAFMQPVIGRLVDRGLHRRTLLAGTLALGAVGDLALCFAPSALPIILCGICSMIGFCCARVVITATTVTWIERMGLGAAAFARYRIFPSLGYTTSSIGGGLLLGHIPFAIIFLAGALLFSLSLLIAPSLPLLAPAIALPTTPVDDLPVVSHARRVLLTLAAMSLLYNVVTSSADSYATLLIRSLHGSFTEVGLLSAIPAIAEVPMMILVGVLAERLSPAAILAYGLLLLPVRLAVFALVQARPLLLGAQIFDGTCFSIYIIVGTALLTAQTPRSERAWSLSIYGATSTIGPILGPLLAGLLATHIGLQGMFGVFALGSLVVPLTLFVGLWPLLPLPRAFKQK